MATHRKMHTASALLAIVVLAGCAGDDSSSTETDPVPTESSTGSETSETEPPAPEEEAPVTQDPADEISEGSLAERDRFLEEQQLPLDGSLLEATTPEQKEFITSQREHVESQGATWTPEVESLTLALTLDACETAILNGHSVDESDVSTHISTSPVFEILVPGDLTGEAQADAEASVADIMVYGMQYICPTDAPQWQEAFTALYPDYR